jgi:hypothetical protein
VKIERLLFFKNRRTQYDVMHHFRESLCAAFLKRGIQIILVDYVENSTSLLRAVYQNPPDCTFAFNGLSPLEDNQFLADILEIPHLAWLIDSAHYFPKMPLSPYNILISPDETSRDLMQAWGSSHSFFLPHAFEHTLAAPPSSNRPYPIVFLGSLMDFEDTEMQWKENLPKRFAHLLIESSEEVLSIPSLTVQAAFEKVRHSHPDFFHSLQEQNEQDLMNTFDYYIRAKARILLLQALKDFPLHIYGNALTHRDWNYYLDTKKGAYTLHPPVNFNQAVEVMRNSQIVLNSSPMFKTGAHERIFYGLGLGASVFTNETPWLSQNFDIGEEILAYPADHPEKALSQLQDLLDHPEKNLSIARKGQQKVLKEHTWDKRADQLIAILEKELEAYHTE